jgi:5-methylcytosine-specific restriction endonuclease McrA
MKNLYCKRLKALVNTDNRFILGEINFNGEPCGLKDIWEGFENKREIRGPRIWPLLPKQELKKCDALGFDILVFDIESSLPWMKKGAGRALFHVAFLEKYFPSILQSSAYLHSAEQGRLIEEHSEIGKKLARNHLSPTERQKVLAEFGGKCYVCKSTEKLTIHHILDREFGGGTEIRNSVPLCQSCHVKVHSKEISRSTLDMLRYRQISDTLKAPQ